MLVIGVSGVTNAGKTTLAKALQQALPRSRIICQDTYYWPKDSPNHVLIPELDHYNLEVMSSLDMNKMWNDIELIQKKFDGELGGGNTPMGKEDTKYDAAASIDNNLDNDLDNKNVNILIIEGFLVLNYKPIADICDLKYHLILSKEVCCTRRRARKYPEVPEYFDLYVWPEYVKHKEEMLCSVRDVKVIDGTQNIKSTLDKVLYDLKKCLNKHKYTSISSMNHKTS